MAACVADVDIIFSSCAFFVLHSFFLALSQPSHSQIGCLPYLHTWCGFTVNVQCRCEMCCTWLGENTGCKNVAKNPHLGNMAQLCGAISSQVKARIDNPKKKFQARICLLRFHNMVNFGVLVAVTILLVWAPLTNVNAFCLLAALLSKM